MSRSVWGVLIVDFAQDIDGCEVHIIEIDGADNEGADVSLYSDLDNPSTCVTLGAFETEGLGGGAGVEHTFDL